MALCKADLLTKRLQQSELLAEDLQKQGFKAKAFHAGMHTEAKTRLQDEFMKKDGMIVSFSFKLFAMFKSVTLIAVC